MGAAQSQRQLRVKGDRGYQIATNSLKNVQILCHLVGNYQAGDETPGIKELESNAGAYDSKHLLWWTAA